MVDRNPDWREKDLYFDFSQAESVFSLDNHGRGHGMSKIMKAVDFVVEWQDEFWLIEVKDPEDSSIPLEHQDKQRADFFKKIQSKSLIYAELFPKFYRKPALSEFGQGYSCKTNALSLFDWY